MLITETIEINGIQYLYTHSDKGMMIERDGTRYAEAIDPLNSGRIYTETDEPIEGDEATESDYQDALREFGVGV